MDKDVAYNAILLRNKRELNLAIWDLEGIMLTGRSQKEKDK